MEGFNKRESMKTEVIKGKKAVKYLVESRRKTLKAWNQVNIKKDLKKFL
jgi:hypothetical protein